MKKTALLLLFTIAYTAIYSQNLEKALELYNRNNPQEKIYIHFDKEVYKPGETIWLKSYFYLNGLPSALSSNYFLQLSNDKGTIIDQKHYAIAGATSSGNIDLPDTLSSGTYYIRAGSSRMFSSGDDFIYTKPIYVANNVTKMATQGSGSSVDVRFFPEGGKLIDGILTAIAFKAVDELGFPVHVTGIVKSTDNVDIPFQTTNNGIGKLQLRPKSGQKYTAEVTYKGKQFQFPLAQPEASGVNIKVQDEKGGKLFQLIRGEKEKDKFEVIHLVATLNNSVIYDNRISFDGYPSVKGHLLTDSLPSGIIHFTVFDEKMNAIAERLAFVNNREYKAGADLNVQQSGLIKRAVNVYKLQAAVTEPTTLSVSVTDAQTNLTDNENIYSRLLLLNDLNEHVFNSAGYLNKVNDSTKLAIDNLMMTHSWFRYKWSDVLAQKSADERKEKYLKEISGWVQDVKDKQALKAGTLHLFLEDEDTIPRSYVLPVSTAGKFVLDSLFFAGQGRFYYEYASPQGKTKPVTIVIDTTSITTKWPVATSSWISKKKKYPQYFNTSATVNTQKETIAAANAKQMEGVVLQTRQKKPSDMVNDTYASGVFRSMGKMVLDNINQPYSPEQTSVVDYIAQTVRTLKLEGGKFVNLKNFSLMSGKNWEVGAFLNESPIPVGNLRNIRMDEVALIKFYEAGFPGAGSTSPGGAIVVYLKNNTEKPKQQALAAEAFFIAAGYSPIKAFPYVDYSAPDPNRSGAADIRTTLYWNSSIFTSGEKQAVDLRFYNNDSSKSIKVRVAGFDAKGRMIFLEKIVDK